MSNITLYEFSSGVNVDKNGDFIDYQVGKYIRNSFRKSDKVSSGQILTQNGIPISIFNSIAKGELDVKASSIERCAYAGRHLDGWFVVVVADRLPGRANEVSRYFCVETHENEESTIALLYWIYHEQPRFVATFPEDAPYPLLIDSVSRENLSVELSKYEEELLSILEKTSTNYYTINSPLERLNLNKIFNIINEFASRDLKYTCFSWAIDARNASALKYDKVFKLISDSGGSVCHICPIKIPVILNIKEELSGFDEESITIVDLAKKIERLSTLLIKSYNKNSGEEIIQILHELLCKNLEEYKSKFLYIEKIQSHHKNRKKEYIAKALIELIIFPDDQKIIDFTKLFYSPVEKTNTSPMKIYSLIKKAYEDSCMEKKLWGVEETLKQSIISYAFLVNKEDSHAKVRIINVLNRLEEIFYYCFDLFMNSFTNKENFILAKSFLKEEVVNQRLLYLVYKSRVKVDIYKFILQEDSSGRFSKIYNKSIIEQCQSKLFGEFENLFGNDEIILHWVKKKEKKLHYNFSPQKIVFPSERKEKYQYLYRGQICHPDELFFLSSEGVFPPSENK
jgi:hypothetical protein